MGDFDNLPKQQQLNIARKHRIALKKCMGPIKNISESDEDLDELLNSLFETLSSYPMILIDSFIIGDSPYYYLFKLLVELKDSEKQKKILSVIALIMSKSDKIQKIPEVIELSIQRYIEKMFEIFQNTEEEDLETQKNVFFIISKIVKFTDEIDVNILSSNLISQLSSVHHDVKLPLEEMLFSLLQKMNISNLSSSIKEKLVNLTFNFVQNVSSKQITSSDDGQEQIKYALQIISIFLHNGYQDYNSRTVVEFLQSLISTGNTSLIASSINFSRFLKSITDLGDEIFHFLKNSREEEIMRATLLCLNQHYEEWSDNDQLCSIVIDSIEYPLANMSLDIKNSALKILTHAVSSLYSYTKPIILQLINLIPDASDMPLLLYHLCYIRKELEKHFDITAEDDTYTYPEFLNDLEDYSDELLDFTSDQNQQLKNQASELLSSIQSEDD